MFTVRQKRLENNEGAGHGKDWLNRTKLNLHPPSPSILHFNINANKTNKMIGATTLQNVGRDLKATDC